MKRLLVMPTPGLPELGPHIVIDAERFSADLPRAEYLRLLHKWFGAALPLARFECSWLTLGGE